MAVDRTDVGTYRVSAGMQSDCPSQQRVHVGHVGVGGRDQLGIEGSVELLRCLNGFLERGEMRLQRGASLCARRQQTERLAQTNSGVLRQGHHLALHLAPLSLLVCPPPQRARDYPGRS
jgi:hypothetical protein